MLQALPPRPHPKLDVKLLRDYSPKGPVYEVARKCEQARRALKGPVKRIDFSNPARRKEVRLLLLHADHAAKSLRPAPSGWRAGNLALVVVLQDACCWPYTTHASACTTAAICRCLV